MKHAKRHPLIFGTLILTITGLITRIIGFFYRIYLSRLFGEEGMGIYQLLSPALSLSFSLTAAGYQTAISKFVAANTAGRRSDDLKTLLTGSSITLPLSLGVNAVLFLAAEPIGIFLLKEARTISMLRILSFSIPFAALHACINGYYYGMNKAHIPSFSQIAEQVIRMGAVWLLVGYLEKNGKSVTVGLAVEGHLIGEMASAAFTFLALFLGPPQREERQNETLIGETGRQRREQKRVEKENVLGGNAVFANLGPILILALPLMGNRLVLNLLGSAEAILIPSRLIDYGLTNKEALSIYGVLTSMALPFILFPSALTNSMAVLLLPSAAKAQAEKDESRISTMVTLSFRYSCYMGILCIGLFTRFGKSLGTIIFHNELSGSFIMVLCWLCPFMYLATTMGSIQNGLGKTGITFLQNMFAMGIRLVFVLFAVPLFGIRGYLWGFLVSELLLAFLCCFSVRRQVEFHCNMADCVLKPGLVLLISLGLELALCTAIPVTGSFLEIVFHMGIITVCYGAFLGVILR